jgi:hypothetical protein
MFPLYGVTVSEAVIVHEADVILAGISPKAKPMSR